MTHNTETLARKVADELGRDWSDCGEYERQSFRDEAQRRQTRETAEDAIRDFLKAADRGYLGTLPPGFNDSAFVKSLRKFK